LIQIRLCGARFLAQPESIGRIDDHRTEGAWNVGSHGNFKNNGREWSRKGEPELAAR